MGSTRQREARTSANGLWKMYMGAGAQAVAGTANSEASTIAPAS